MSVGPSGTDSHVGGETRKRIEEVDVDVDVDVAECASDECATSVRRVCVCDGVPPSTWPLNVFDERAPANPCARCDCEFYSPEKKELQRKS
jgi:hypothetical protein